MELNNTCGRAGGKKNAHVAATTPTPPIAHNAPHMKGCGIHPGGCLALHSARNRRDRLPQRRHSASVPLSRPALLGDHRPNLSTSIPPPMKPIARISGKTSEGHAANTKSRMTPKITADHPTTNATRPRAVRLTGTPVVHGRRARHKANPSEANTMTTRRTIAPKSAPSGSKSAETSKTR